MAEALPFPLGGTGLIPFKHSHGYVVIDREAITAIVSSRDPGFSLTEVWTGAYCHYVLETFEEALRSWAPMAPPSNRQSPPQSPPPPARAVEP